jgi:RecB family exonuclease
VVCVPGLVEKGFPAPPREDPLLSDRERARLARAGLSLPLKGERAEEERLLFRLAVGAGARRVILTYPRLEMSSARERVPSYFLLRVAEAATGRRCDYKHLEDFPGYERVSSPAFAPKRAEEAWRSAEYDLAATLEAVALGDASPLGYLGRLSPTFGSALRAEERRWGERRFTEYDGVLRSKAALAALAERLGPMPWHLSPTELELYASCPFRYFVARVLRVREIEEPEAILRLSGMDRGSLVHDILYRALTAAKREGRLPLKIEDEDRVLAEARESFARFEQEGATGIEALWALERGSLELDLRRFVLDEATHTEGYVPAFFEVHFGKTAHGKPSELGSDEGVLFELGPQGSLRIVGRIDRIDLCAARKQARVIDYKTGAKPQGIKPDAFAGGTALQLPLYLQAAGALLGDRAVVAEATYRFLTARGGYESVAFHREAYEEHQEQLLVILRTIAEGIAQGRFFPGGDGAPCRGCDYRAVCGAGTAALAQRKADDAVTRPYRTMREIP